MRISKTLDVDVQKLGFRYDDDTGERTVIATLRFLVGSNEAAEIFDESFRSLVFGAMTAEGQLRFETLKPSFTFEQHLVRFGGDGKQVSAMPEFDKVKSAGPETVAVYLKVTFDLNRDAVIRLVDSFGGGVGVEFEPAQISLPLGDAGVSTGVAAH